MNKKINTRLEEITISTLIVGVDIAKEVHYARFVDYRGAEVGKTITFKGDKKGFEHIITQIEKICKLKILKQPYDKGNHRHGTDRALLETVRELSCKKR